MNIIHNFTNTMFELGLQHGKLSHDYQPTAFPAPTGLLTTSQAGLGPATFDDQQSFWRGWHIGWDTQEAATLDVTFTKQEV